MKTSSRRSFLKKAGIGAAGLTLSGFCRTDAIEAKEEILHVMPVTGKVIDAHSHADAESIGRYLKVMDDNYIHYAVNIGVTGDQDFYKFISAAKPHKNRIGTMYAFDWSLIKKDPEFFSKAPDMLTRGRGRGDRSEEFQGLGPDGPRRKRRPAACR